MSIESTILPMLLPNGANLDAKVEWEAANYWECRVSIDCDGKVSGGRRIDYFDALEEACLPFKANGYRLLCYEANLDVLPLAIGWSCVSFFRGIRSALISIGKFKQ
tara:strand:- start:203 stop:520 length:318 start_codon:yes stop_codon:yes gene_type:complete